MAILQKTGSILNKFKWRRGDPGLIEKVILMVIALFVFAILVPVALNQIYSTNTSGWNSAVIPLFNIFVPVISILAIAIGFVAIMLRRRD